MDIDRHLQLTEIGKRIREHRNRLGLSQGDLANILGISYQQLQKYEKGKSPLPSDRLQRMAQRFAIPLAALLAPEETDASGPAVPFATDLDREEALVLEAFRALSDPRVKNAVLEFLMNLASRR